MRIGLANMLYLDNVTYRVEAIISLGAQFLRLVHCRSFRPNINWKD